MHSEVKLHKKTINFVPSLLDNSVIKVRISPKKTASATMPMVKLIYFAAEGRGELTRILLNIGTYHACIKS